MLFLVERVSGEHGREYSLYENAGEYIIRVNGYELMSSRCHGSEEKLASAAVENMKVSTSPKILVGGLGMGFTLGKLLNILPPSACVKVAELEPAVIRWNRKFFGELNGDALSDPRVDLWEGDVITLIGGDNLYDAIILDIDNGPSPLSAEDNIRIYSDEGIDCIYRSLSPGGIFALWSAFMDGKFVERLEKSGFSVTVQHVYSDGNTSSGEYLIFLCSK
jgi:spermidine synthase